MAVVRAKREAKGLSETTDARRRVGRRVIKGAWRLATRKTFHWRGETYVARRTHVAPEHAAAVEFPDFFTPRLGGG